MISGIGARSGFSALMMDGIPDVQAVDNGQIFPSEIAILDEDNVSGLLFSNPSSDVKLSFNCVNSLFVKKAQTFYNVSEIQSENLFYYIYAILCHWDYQKRFVNNLSKSLPRIPFCKEYSDFTRFVDAGKELANIHCNFEEVEPHPILILEGDLRLTHIEDPKSFFRVEKMKFSKKTDKSTVIYNKNITIQGIPLEAYEYVVNGKPALEWVMDRQCVKTDKASGIVNDANDYANETMNNPAYPLELFQRVITVSLETMKIVKSLPKLDID